LTDRLNKLRSQLATKGLDALLVSQAENRRYLSGFTGSAGFLLISQQKAILATDFRYVEQAQVQAPGFEVVQIQGDIAKWFPGLIAELQARKLGFEGKSISFSTYKELTDAINNIKIKISLIPTEGLVESLRAVKDKEELRLVEKAADLADAALEYIIPRIKPGALEKEVAWEIESFLRQNGSESVPFELIVASGPNSAMPHARPTDRAIRQGEPVVIDIGATVDGYTSDMTRTICLGNGDNMFNKVYDIVLGAQLTAMATLQAGMTGEQADRLARIVIEQAGYKDAFGHGLGHGVGLATHEEPRLGKSSIDILAEGMVFTIEPGIYISDWGGVRIEDMVVLEEGKVRPLTKAKKVWRP